MLPSLAPIDADPADRPLGPFERANVDLQSLKALSAAWRQPQASGGVLQPPARQPAVEQADGEPAREMVVARPRLSHRLVARPGARAQMANARGDRDQRFDGCCNV